MTTHSPVIPRIHAALAKISAGIGDVADDQELLESGLLDSLSVMRLIAQIEADFNIALPLMDLSIENLSTVTALAGLVERLQQP